MSTPNSSTTPSDRTCGHCGISASSLPEGSNLSQCSRCKSAFYCNRECQSAAWAEDKPHCKRQNFVLKFHLCPQYIVNPPVIRTLSVPATATLETLHKALQIAFGWAGTHAYDFAVLDPAFEPPTAAEYMEQGMKMDMRGDGMLGFEDPREYIVRVVHKPEEYVRGYKIDRMHEGRRRHPRTEERRSDRTKVYELWGEKGFADKAIEYTYDFGDNWVHVVTLEGRAPPTERIVCLSGTGHGVAEDIGSDQGWENLKKAYRTANPDKEQRFARRMYETKCINGDKRGLGDGREYEFKLEEVNAALARNGL
ncbi:uncharacterized protein EI97DRAFT_488020 [Westerdykella ornata]|uniref:MYND-type domain-containing protein n=1 Tax=Westerdykella ornata TaxID=318751 RepID=A0A6A6JPS6_WESOR|nr:uncharacterized protein EI97DRAFT_488020 [Westerdykella ornata]KAF2277908.1 hypothetical protein EI97DRAFT_488020 [Westerdykella ornata]